MSATDYWVLTCIPAMKVYEAGGPFVEAVLRDYDQWSAAVGVDLSWWWAQ